MKFYSQVSIACLAAVSLSACASIVAGRTNTIKIATTPATQAQCTLKNQRGTWSGSTQNNVIVKRSRTDLDVSCVNASSGQQGKQTLVSGIEPWLLGNILFGGLIGLGIDFGTGAAYDYPENVTVAMSRALVKSSAPVVSNGASSPSPLINSTPQTTISIPQEQVPTRPAGFIAAPPVYIPAAQ